MLSSDAGLWDSPRGDAPKRQQLHPAGRSKEALLRCSLSTIGLPWAAGCFRDPAWGLRSEQGSPKSYLLGSLLSKADDLHVRH